MTDQTTARTHCAIEVQQDTHINAPVSVHGHCFGLIPANGCWLDDVIDWQARQFRQAEVARRMAACWNACKSVSTEELIREFGAGDAAFEAGGQVPGLDGCDQCRHTFCRLNELCRACGHVAEGQGWKGGQLDSLAKTRVTDVRDGIVAALASSRDTTAGE